MSDTKLNGVLGVLVRLCLRPTPSYSDPGRKDEILAEPSIVICNHTCHLDGPILNTVLLPHIVHTLAAKDRFEQRSFGFFLRHTGCIPIDRTKADTSWLHESLRILKVQKESIVIYPEGRHGAHRQQLPFHPAVITLAVMAQVPIVMVYQDGPARWFRRNRLIITPPFRLPAPEGGISSDFVQKQTDFLQNKLKELMEQFITLETNKSL